MRGVVWTAMFAIVLSVQGCSLFPFKNNPVPVVKTVEVKVPVVVKQAPPEALQSCGTQSPGFLFYPSGDGSDDIVIRSQDQDAFRHWVEDKVKCIEAWGAWADE